jgi:hypothetical protein
MTLIYLFHYIMELLACFCIINSRCFKYGLLFLSHIIKPQIDQKVDQTVLEPLVSVPLNDMIEPLREVLKLVFGPLGAVGYVLHRVQGYSCRATVGIQTLKRFPILDSSFEKGRIHWESDRFVYSFVFIKGVDPFFLEYV